MPKLMRPLIATAMLAGALLSAPALAAQNFNPEDYVGTARIVGQVVDAQTGTPLMGARVSIPGLEKHSVTNRDGRFLLADLALGRYSVAVEQLGFMNTATRCIRPTRTTTGAFAAAAAPMYTSTKPR